MHTLESGRYGRRPGGRPDRPGRGRFSPPLSWGAGIVLAVAVLVFCYLRIAGTTQVISDGAGDALQAWDMLHGNLLLHGWWAADVSFYTTELPQYMIVEAVAGLRPEVVHICAALTYTLLVLLAALLARGRAGGPAGWVRALLAVGIMLAPEPGSATFVLLGSPDHVGTAVPVLLVLLLLDWAKPRWYVPVAVGALLAWSLVGDPLILVIGVLPVVTVCLARVGVALSRRVPARTLWYEFSLAVAAAVAVPAAQAATHVLRALGGYSSDKIPLAVGSGSVLRGNIPWAIRGVLTLFGADVSGVRGGLNQAFAVIHLAGVALVLTGVAMAAWRLVRSLASRRQATPPRADAAAPRTPDLVADLLVVAIVANITAYFFLFRLKNTFAAHEIGPVVALGAALAGRMLGGPLLRARLVPALAAGLACYTVMLGFAVARPQTPPDSVALAAWLARHDLRDGLGGYWQASSVTLDSGGTIFVGSVAQGPSGRLSPWHWLTDLRSFDPSQHTANFVVALPAAPQTTSQALATFGRPARVYHLPGYTILVWHKNLLRQLGPSFWNS